MTIPLLTQSVPTPAASVDTAAIAAAARARLDSVVAQLGDSLHRASTDRYVELLERANGIRASWMEVFIGALGLLFAVGSIVAAYLLWRQSRDYREKIDAQFQANEQLRAEQQATFDSLLAGLAQQSKDLLAEIERVRASATETPNPKPQSATDQLEALAAQVESLESRIRTVARMQPLQATMTAVVVPRTVDGKSLYARQCCRRCGTTFPETDAGEHSPDQVKILDKVLRHCVECGSLQTVRPIKIVSSPT